MSVRLRGTDSVVELRWIPKYTGLERTLHWVHTACFLPLALTLPRPSALDVESGKLTTAIDRQGRCEECDGIDDLTGV